MTASLPFLLLLRGFERLHDHNPDAHNVTAVPLDCLDVSTVPLCPPRRL